VLTTAQAKEGRMMRHVLDTVLSDTVRCVAMPKAVYINGGVTNATTHGEMRSRI